MISVFSKKKEKYPLDVKCFESLHSQKNGYLIMNNQEAAAIDTLDSFEEMARFLDEKQARMKYLLITHAHPSHLQGLPEMKKRFGGTFCMHKSDQAKIRKSGIPIEPDVFLKDNMKLSLGQVEIRVLHTPGHTEGSLCFWVKNGGVLFSGSTLLKDGYGKIRGNAGMSLMLFSLKRLNYTIPPETLIYPRTGEPTTMGDEYWLDCLRSH